MLIILAIIGGIVAILTASYHLQKFGKDRYQYCIFSSGGMGVTFIGAVALVFACTYYHQGLMLNMIIAVTLGVTPYIGMVIRDAKRTSIPVAITALMLRFTISALFIMVILWFFFMRPAPRKEQPIVMHG